MTRKLVLRVWTRRNSKNVEWKQVVAREKAKFKMKIIGKKKVNWVREGRSKI